MHLKASEETRRLARKPLGVLLKDEDLWVLLKGFNGVLISVGDIVSKRLLDMGFNPAVCVVDGKTMRTCFQDVKRFQQGRRVLRLVNPPGTISDESWSVFKEALDSQPSTILVEGEEDLLTLVAVKTAPNGSLVMYGQPEQGVVAVNANESSKKIVSDILGTMEACE
ncbi:MAG: GTP-dependent dephospho-CoA kinase family protein [Thermofilum sp.]